MNPNSLRTLLIALAALAAVQVQSQLPPRQPPPSRTPVASQPKPSLTAEYTITSREPNSRIWERIEYQAGQDGKPVPVTHRYVER